MSDYMKEFYFGSLVWDKKTYDVFVDKPIIRFKSVQEMLDQTKYESKGKFRLDVIGVLKKARFNRILESNPNIDHILNSLGFNQIDELCRLCYSPVLDNVIDKNSNEKIGHTHANVELKAESRKLFFNKPFIFNKDVYTGIEFKGCGKEGGPIEIDNFRRIGNTCIDTGPEGGAYASEVVQEAKIQGELNKKGKTNPLQIVAFELPIKVVSPYFGEQQLGLLIRGVKSSFRISELLDTANDVISTLNISAKEYCEKVTENLFKDLKLIFQAGYFHNSPNDSNVDGSGGITDLGDILPLENGEQIYYNLLNFKRTANLLWYYTTRKYNEKYVLDKMTEVFETSKYDIKGISNCLIRHIKSNIKK